MTSLRILTIMAVLLFAMVGCVAAGTPAASPSPTSNPLTGGEVEVVTTALATSSPEAAGDPTVVTMESPAAITPAPEGTLVDPSITQVAEATITTLATEANATNVPAPAVTPSPIATVGGAGEVVPTLAATLEPAGNSMPEIIMVFVRDGGFAGYCDTMTVRQTNATVESCQQPQRSANITPGVQDELATLAQRYSSTVIQQSDAPGAADNMTITIEFYGVGLELLTPEVETRLVEIGNELISQAASEQ